MKTKLAVLILIWFDLLPTYLNNGLFGDDDEFITWNRLHPICLSAAMVRRPVDRWAL